MSYKIVNAALMKHTNNDSQINVPSIGGDRSMFGL